MTTQTFSATGVRWDPGDLFVAHDDPRIQATLADCLVRAQAFAQRYRDTIRVSGGPDPEHLLAAVRELEGAEFRARVCYDPCMFCELRVVLETFRQQLAIGLDSGQASGQYAKPRERLAQCMGRTRPDIGYTIGLRNRVQDQGNERLKEYING